MVRASQACFIPTEHHFVQEVVAEGWETQAL